MLDRLMKVLASVLRPLELAIGYSIWRLGTRIEVGDLPTRVIDPDGHPDLAMRRLLSDQLEAAICILRQYDPPHHQRLLRNVRRISLIPGKGPAYHHTHRVVLFSPTQIASWHPQQIATKLVHEATHAWLRNRGVAITPQRRRRIERICIRAEMIFARRMAAESSPMLEHLKLSLMRYAD